MLLSSGEKVSPHVKLGFFVGKKIQLGEHNSVGREMWKASVSLTIPKRIFPQVGYRGMMEQ